MSTNITPEASTIFSMIIAGYQSFKKPQNFLGKYYLINSISVGAFNWTLFILVPVCRNHSPIFFSIFTVLMWERAGFLGNTSGTNQRTQISASK
jgi:hypothetical protein